MTPSFRWARRRTGSLLTAIRKFPAPARRRSLRRDARGSVTVEAALWSPVIFAVMGLVTDAATIYALDARMWHVAADTARRMSVGELDAASAPGFARAALPARLREVAVIETLDTADEVGLAVRAGTAAMSPIGLYAALIDAEAVARVSMAREGALALDIDAFLGGVGAGAPAGGS